VSPAKKLKSSRTSEKRFDVAGMERAVRAFLKAAGLEVEGTMLEETPALVSRAWASSFLDGYEKDPGEILKGAYSISEDATGSGMVLLKDIAFHGVCPHHLLPFHGMAHVAYLPGRRLASLSSLARLVDCFAHRLEIQETVTRQIAEALEEHLGTRGTAVVLEADQTCLTARGIEKVGARTVTRHVTGAFLEDSGLCSELLTGIGAPNPKAK
jgi:GTP cyclohydrolase I